MSGKAYVPGMRHDIFVSYPWVEEQFPGGETGWVSALYSYLCHTIPRYLDGRATLDIWMDRRLPGNASVTAEITTALDGAAILLVVLGRQYQASPWCMDELDHFHSRIDRCDEDIFLVFTDDIPFRERPPSVQSLKGFRFWKQSSGGVCRRLGSPRPRPDDPNHADFFEAAEELSRRLASRMNSLRAQALPKASVSANGTPPRTGESRDVKIGQNKPLGAEVNRFKIPASWIRWAVFILAVLLVFSGITVFYPALGLLSHSDNGNPIRNPVRLEQSGTGAPVGPIRNQSQTEVASIPDGLRQGAAFRQCENCPLMVAIRPNGSVAHASGRHDSMLDAVTASRILAVSRFEITFSEWDFYCERNRIACRHFADDHGWGRGQRPVIDVSWSDAEAYGAWLQQLTSQEYRLPTAREWEYLARSGSSSERCAIQNAHDLDDYAWLKENSGGKTHAVDEGIDSGSMKANAWGIFHMFGNVSEWVRDCWRDDDAERAAADGPELDQDCPEPAVHEVRGGSWADDLRFLTCSTRMGMNAETGHRDVGFRLVIERRFIPRPALSGQQRE